MPGLWLAAGDPIQSVAALARVVLMAGLVWLTLATIAQTAVAAGGRAAGVTARAVPGLPRGIRRRIEATVAALAATGTLAVPVAAAATPGLPSYVPVPPQVTNTSPATPPAAPGPPAMPSMHVVEPGDHLWGIAERRVRAHHPAADVQDVAAYWREVVGANGDLPSGDPDLIRPGEQVRLPRHP